MSGQLEGLDIEELYQELRGTVGEEIATALKEEAISGGILVTLTEEELKEVIPKLGHRKKLQMFKEGYKPKEVKAKEWSDQAAAGDKPKPDKTGLSKAIPKAVVAPLTTSVQQRLALRIKHKSDLLFVEAHNVYKPPTTVETNSQRNAAKVAIGAAHSNCSSITHYIVMLVGAVGAGKSTLINGIANYLLGVQWTDDFRFKLITDQEGALRTHSQTQCITAYTFHKQDGSLFPYCLTIIDTPGFGDAEGLQRHTSLFAEIKDFLLTPSPDGTNCIHAIGFVIHASSTRLSATQRYIYDSLVTVFGRSIVSNILLLTTFADSKTPPVLEAARRVGLTFYKSLKFNNSSLYPMQGSTMEDDMQQLDRMFWELTENSYTNFCDALKRMEVCNLLERRRGQSLKKAILVGLNTQLQVMDAKIDQFEQEEKLFEFIKENTTAAGKNLNWLVEAPTMSQVAMSEKDLAINCSECQFTCYCNVPFPDGSVVCEVCPKKCAKDRHHCSDYIRVPGVVKVVTTYENLKKRYKPETEDDDSDQVEALITSLRMEKAALYKQVFQALWDVQRNIHELEKPVPSGQRPFSVLEHIDTLTLETDVATPPADLNAMKHLYTIRKAANFMAGLGEESAFCTKAQEVALKMANAPDTAQRASFAANKKWWLEWYQ